MSDNYPEHAPPKPDKLKGVATVKGGLARGLIYTVNFDTMECDCTHGQAWRWNDKKWVPNGLCAHKLKALSSLIDSEKPNSELADFYEKSVGRRHNAFVAVSAMHKELRRGDVEAALYWATVMIPHRGMAGVINYMRNIVFEETRDLELYKYILTLSEKGKSVSRLEMNRGIARFAKAPKKWELPWRLDIFKDEQKGYEQLAKKYSYEVAKPQDIIPNSELNSLHKSLLIGFKMADRVKVQYGLKGLLKLKTDNYDKHRIAIFNYLVDILNEDFPSAFKYDEEYTRRLHGLIMRRIRNHGAPVYHELNALCDALTGEAGAKPLCTLTTPKHRLITLSKREYTLPLGDLRRIPLYANDNHTWPGKALMRQYGDTELQPGVRQQHIDFRYWGAYAGVAWRLLAYQQHATIDCKWESVAWKPSWIWQHCSRMNY